MMKAEDINYDVIPPHCQAGMRAWIEDGHMPGSFLRAVITNDFRGAVTLADEINSLCLRSYAIFLYQEAPHGSYGSTQAMAAWAESGGLKGARKAANA